MLADGEVLNPPEEPHEILHVVRHFLRTPEGESLVKWTREISEFLEEEAGEKSLVDCELLMPWRKRP